jgi:hypothetical protein
LRERHRSGTIETEAIVASGDEKFTEMYRQTPTSSTPSSMCKKLIASFLVLLGMSSVLTARLIQPWTYQEMFDKADLVVIGRFSKTADTDERTVLLDHINVVGVLTEFETKLILKGDKKLARFQLHHYRLKSGDDWRIANGPALVEFRGPHPEFLLFLTRERYGKYKPVTGQTDPAGISVIELVTY